MEQNQFDKKVKESLEHLEVPFNATPWNKIEQALDALDVPVTPVAENDFDAFISNKLVNLSIPARQPNWERMSAALDEVETSTAFDKEVKSKINTFNPVYQPSHWELLAAQLRREKSIKESLYKNKIAEFALFLLLLLNFHHYFPNFPATAALPIATENLTKKTVETPPRLVESTPQKQTNPSAVNQNIATTNSPTINKIANATAKEIVAVDKLVHKSAIANDNKLYVLSDLTTIDINGVSSQPSRQQIEFGIDGKTGLTITVPEMAQHLDRVGLTSDLFVETLPSLVPASLATAKIIPLDCEQCKRFKIPALFRFGMVGHLGLIKAEHSSTQALDFSTEQESHIGVAYGSGFTLGFKFNRWEIETGLIYAEKRYDHFALHNKYPHQLKGLSLQTIQVPVNLRYNYGVLDDGKLHLYVQPGAAFNFVLREEQDIIKLSQSEASWLGANATSIATSRTFVNKSNEGLFGGDGFKDNLFLTVNFGAGAEYYLSPKWSIFLQPDFQYYFSATRIGPTKDKVHNLSLSFGVRSTFY